MSTKRNARLEGWARALAMGLLVPLVVHAQQSPPATAAFVTPRQMTAEEVLQFDRELAAAPAQSYFFLHLIFAQPVRIGELRELTRRLSIPRIAAMVEFRSLTVPGQTTRMPFVLGTFYDNEDAWNHQVCRAIMYEGVAETSSTSPADWPVREVFGLASAEASRALRSPNARAAQLIRGAQQRRPSDDALIAGAKQELAELFDVRPGSQVDAVCQPFIRPRPG